MERKVRIKPVFVFFIIIILLLFGCNFLLEQKNEAKDILEEVEGHMSEYDDLSSEIAKTSQEFNQSPSGIEGDKLRLELVKDAKDLYEKQKDELEQAKSELEKIDDLRISQEMKEFAEKSINVVDAYLEIIDVAMEANKESEEIYSKIVAGTVTSSEYNNYLDSFNKSNQEVLDLTEELREIEEEAQDYYEQEELKEYLGD